MRERMRKNEREREREGGRNKCDKTRRENFDTNHHQVTW